MITRNSKLKYQFAISVILIVSIAATCFTLSQFIDYKIVAFLLLVTVSVQAAWLDIKVVLVASFLSALIWDFFFIPPHFTLTIGSIEDRIFLLMYLLIAIIASVLTNKIRQFEKVSLLKEEKEKSIILYNLLLNSLSHELRTPLATIIGTTDTLQENLKTLTTESQQDLLKDISDASLRLNQQISNLLNMSRLETGTLKIKTDWCDVSELIFDNINKIDVGKHSFDVHFQKNLPYFKLDYGLIDTVIFNILTNEIAYTPVGSKIKIEVNCLNTTTGHFEENSEKFEAVNDTIESVLNIVISDNGHGFPEDEIDFVFDKFYRLKNSKAGGTGLGLSIVKGFVEAHNGTIELKNNFHGGATFNIEIPTETTYINALKNE